MGWSGSISGALVLVVAAACGKTDAAPQTPWSPLAQGEATARREHKPALLFVHAEWSVADNMLEHETLPSADVRLAMRDFVAIDVDVTDDEAPGVRAVMNRFAVVGVPTILAIADFDRYPAENAGYANPSDLFRANEFLKAPELAAGLRSAKARFDRRPPPAF